MKRFFLIVFILSLAINSGYGQIFHKSSPRSIEKGLFSKSHGRRKEIKVREPRTVLKAKKKQEAKERKLKRDYAEAIKRSQKRSFDIQTAEVQARMKQDKKDAVVREKMKKKKMMANTKKAGKKYK